MKKLIKHIVKQALPVLLEILKARFGKQSECKPVVKEKVKEQTPQQYLKPLVDWGKNVTQPFANPNPTVYKKTGHHIGVDHASPLDTPIYAPADGEITQSDNWGAMGNFVVCRYAQDRWLVACHLKRTMPTGLVNRGNVIGRVGKSGFIQGIHSHIEVWRKDPGKREILPPDFADNWRDYLVDPMVEFE